MTTLACIGGFDGAGMLVLSGIALTVLVGVPAVSVWLVGLLFD